MKRVVLFLAIVLIGFGVYAVGYFSTYSITKSEEAAEEFLIEFDEKKSGMGVLTVVGWMQLGESDSWLARVLFEDGIYGYAHFVKGWNGKMKFMSLSTTQPLTYREFQTDDGFYGVVFGRNDNQTIDHINVRTLGRTTYEFVIHVADLENFMVGEKLPEGVQDTFPAEFKVVDKDGNVIKM